MTGKWRSKTASLAVVFYDFHFDFFVHLCLGTDIELIAAFGEDMEIPNTAKVSINGNPKTSNEVIVVPPSQPTKKIYNQIFED